MNKKSAPHPYLLGLLRFAALVICMTIGPWPQSASTQPFAVSNSPLTDPQEATDLSWLETEPYRELKALLDSLGDKERQDFLAAKYYMSYLKEHFPALQAWINADPAKRHPRHYPIIPVRVLDPEIDQIISSHVKTKNSEQATALKGLLQGLASPQRVEILQYLFELYGRFSPDATAKFKADINNDHRESPRDWVLFRQQEGFAPSPRTAEQDSLARDFDELRESAPQLNDLPDLGNEDYYTYVRNSGVEFLEVSFSHIRPYLPDIIGLLSDDRLGQKPLADEQKRVRQTVRRTLVKLFSNQQLSKAFELWQITEEKHFEMLNTLVTLFGRLPDPRLFAYLAEPLTFSREQRAQLHHVGGLRGLQGFYANLLAVLDEEAETDENQDRLKDPRSRTATVTLLEQPGGLLEYYEAEVKPAIDDERDRLDILQRIIAGKPLDSIVADFDDLSSSDAVVDRVFSGRGLRQLAPTSRERYEQFKRQYAGSEARLLGWINAGLWHRPAISLKFNGSNNSFATYHTLGDIEFSANRRLDSELAVEAFGLFVDSQLDLLTYSHFAKSGENAATWRRHANTEPLSVVSGLRHRVINPTKPFSYDVDIHYQSEERIFLRNTPYHYYTLDHLSASVDRFPEEDPQHLKLASYVYEYTSMVNLENKRMEQQFLGNHPELVEMEQEKETIHLLVMELLTTKKDDPNSFTDDDQADLDRYEHRLTQLYDSSLDLRIQLSRQKMSLSGGEAFYILYHLAHPNPAHNVPYVRVGDENPWKSALIRERFNREEELDIVVGFAKVLNSLVYLSYYDLNLDGLVDQKDTELFRRIAGAVT